MVIGRTIIIVKEEHKGKESHEFLALMLFVSAPHEEPSTTMLFLCQTLTKDPQQVWQTLKNFDYPEVLS